MAAIQSGRTHGSSAYDQVRYQEELHSFQSIWHGGYFEGNPLDPMGPSSFGAAGYMSILHATYLACIKPYVNKDTVALEIGPGRGGWTKCLLPAKEVWCMDALSAEHNGFWEYLDHPSHVKYFQVSDYSCDVVPNDTFNYLFSFGCLCHVAFESVEAYMTNIYPKLKDGARCFIMIADYDKWNASIDQSDYFDIARAFPEGKRYSAMRLLWKILNYKASRVARSQYKDKNEDNIPRPGRWYHSGVDRTCTMLESLGYTIIDPDMGTDHRDPIVHFMK